MATRRTTAPRTPARARPGKGRASNPDQTQAAGRTGYMATAQGRAMTVVYVHGIGNKPPAEVLRCQWDKALFGMAMGERTRMAYWVNRARYPVPEVATCAQRDEGPTISQAEQRLLSVYGLPPGPGDLRDLVDDLATTPREQADLRALLDQMQAGAAAPSGPAASSLWSGLNEILLRLVSAALLQDVHDFFFVPARRQAMEESLRERLLAGGGPFVVIGHSQGSMIAYEVLRKLKASECDVALFLTLGSPLGLPAVRSMFKQDIGKRKLPFPACVRAWHNVADRRDPVALDADLGDDIQGANGRFSNEAGTGINPDGPRNPHSGSGYLSIDSVRQRVRGVVGAGFDQPVTQTVVLKDLSDRMEAEGNAARHEVLFELDQLSAGLTQDAVRLALVEKIRALAGRQTGLSGEALDETIVLEDTLERFVSARLTRFEIESLRDDYQALHFKRLWRDAGKRALLDRSRRVIQADAAQVAYHALGQDIGWAVLDTGIAAGHPHFHADKAHPTVVAQWDCTVRGRPRQLGPDDGRAFTHLDRAGHGTHVAGIIAGQCSAPLPGDKGGKPVDFTAVAPQARLYGFKVLDDAGNGRDSWIIKGIQQVARINEQAGQLVIHGVNLSLGGWFDAESYGCGFTPLCNELRRLWRQGVVVVLAAGNEGLAWLVQQNGMALAANMDMTIGDPANLEEAIAVGSVHKSNPRTYGVSYFSSKGPTADGRRKPDVVAPGEKIISAHYDYRVRDRSTWMVEMSGTSMAAPHVSGLVAAFLSVRREFIGFPDKVKDELLARCNDIGRDPYMQGRGVPNLVKMLAET
ncbi:S8 family serine peptidase [Pseudoxanthomonas sp. JBR18]|uniref:S8 family serine peptidase n=1 Tax=Pseudoxanthomonas sp. JBR18 TaxID=2969308 RepID=UPI0023051016|nr:S8 family serine peptidase [Pseudoxanthomonas sp. JBR18]WCE03654.1 S8 family serine peptidase [Pseudoxanthomonas sp. JBR18]